jgi:uncharacterized membrane protein
MSSYRLSTERLPQTEFDIPRLTYNQPISWLRRGWQDLRTAPVASLVYGLFVAAFAILLAYLTSVANGFYLVPFLFGGFLMIAPLLSVGLMAIAKLHEEQAALDTASVLRILATNRPSIAIMGIFLLFAFLNWIMLSNLLFGGVFHEILPTYDQVRPLPVMFGESLAFLAVFGGIALVLAIILFRITALSLPMLVDRKVDPFNAAFASWRAVGENWRAMAVWAVIIAVLFGISVLTYFAGLILIVPWLGYASWHAYRDTLVPQS